MRTPVSTYRLQIRPGFTLPDAADTVPYLKSLGVDWVYLSPILTAEQGSDHGYDVTDPSAVDPDRGGPEGLLAVSRAAREAGMGVLVDIVPNHVGVATPAQNPWWWSLLKEGRQSRYAQAFDVDWDFGGGRIRIPVLGEDSDLDALEIRDGELRYYDHRFPLAEGSYTAGDSTADPARGPRPAALRADRLAAGGQRAELPPVLRRQHPGRDPGRAPGGLRRSPRRGCALVPGRARRRAADRPPGRPRRPGGLPAPAARGHRRRLPADREDPRTGGGAARRLRLRGHHRLRRPRGRGPGLRRRRRAGAARRPRRRAPRRSTRRLRGA